MSIPDDRQALMNIASAVENGSGDPALGGELREIAARLGAARQGPDVGWVQDLLVEYEQARAAWQASRTIANSMQVEAVFEKITRRFPELAQLTLSLAPQVGREP